MKFKTIIADVPAPFRVWSKETGMGRSAECHYRTMTWQSLNELGPLVRAVAAGGLSLACALDGECDAAAIAVGMM